MFNWYVTAYQIKKTDTKHYLFGTFGSNYISPEDGKRLILGSKNSLKHFRKAMKHHPIML